MKLKNLLIISVASLSIASYQSFGAVKLTTETDKESYALGVMQGAQAGELDKNFAIKLNPDLIYAGLKDGLAGHPELQESEIEDVLKKLQQTIQEQQTKKVTELLAENKKANEAFLKDLSPKQYHTIQGSDVRYDVKKAGNAKMSSPTAEDSVEITYAGESYNYHADQGKAQWDEFDKTDKPATLALKALIPGMQDALKAMRPGATWEIYIPAELGYKDRGAPPHILPHSTLKFTVTLEKVVPADKK